MDLDTSYIEPLIDDWMEHLQEIVKQQKQERIKTTKFIVPLVALPASTINTAFKIANYLELDSHVKYMAIHLYDKFMCKRFWELYETDSAMSQEEWIKICKKAAMQAKLHLVSCFQLACKMDSHCINLGISQVFNVLRLINKQSEYTRNMIAASEIEVFKTVEYKMPLYTPLNCVEILLAATGLRETPNTINISIDLLDLAYLKYDKLFPQFYMCYSHVDDVNIQQKLLSLKTNMLFLSAAIVFCTTYFVSLEIDIAKEEIIATKLAKVSNTTSVEIFNMANILLLAATQD